MDLKQIETEIDEYIVMSRSKYPEVAKSYLMEGFNLGVEYASKPSTNSDYAAALKVVSEFRRSSSGNKGLWQLQTWCEKRLHAEEQRDA